MGRGGLNQKEPADTEYTWDEIKKHTLMTDKWIVVDDLVYDVTRWSKKHPGGAKIVSSYAGQDASDAWYAFHTNKKYVEKFMKPLCVGRVKGDTNECDVSKKVESPLTADWHKLRKTAEDMGLFRTNVLFFSAIMAHILLFEAVGWYILYRFGNSWIPYILATVCLTVAQAQAGWSQHDYGHLSVCKSTRFNHWIQIFVLNFFKGASCDWWNFRHYNHHAKPNIVSKDPDIKMEGIFVLGDVIPKEYGQKKKTGYMPYNQQHNYFFFILPPLLLPLYFNFEIPYFLITRKRWSELMWMATFFVRWQFMFSPLVGVGGVFALFMFVRFLESHWFVWATQMSHLPMEVNHDQDEEWFPMQLKATCNIEPSFFNNWFSGHLNFQIEHHLFPAMPRHNLHKIAPLVKSLCEKYHIDYQNKPLLTAFKDIVGSLKKSGAMWYDAYHHK